MLKKHTNFFLVVLILVVAVLSGHSVAVAYTVTDTFTDIVGQGLDPGNFALINEHGGASFTNDDTISLSWIYSYGGNPNLLRVDITNTSNHNMWNTFLAFEQSAWDWKGLILASNSWDGTDSSDDAAYSFGTITAGNSSTRYINLKPGGFKPALAYNSLGLDSAESIPHANSNLSVLHAAPEPISSILFLAGGATLGLRNFRRKKTVS